VLVAVAMGAGRVVAAGRNPDKLRALAHLAGKAVVPVTLAGDVQADATALREAAGGGAEIAFDMVGSATDPRSTLAALNALNRRGRLVLMGGMSVDLPIPYLQLMLNSLEIIGNFMHRPDAYRQVLALVRAGRLDLSAITPRVYPLADLVAAMGAAETAGSFEAIVVTP
jgi:alcohol dehydrogenase